MRKILGICTACACAIWICGISYPVPSIENTISETTEIIVEDPIPLYSTIERFEVEYGAEPIEEIVFVSSASDDDIQILKAQEALDELNTISDKLNWFLTYKEIIEEYAEWVDAPESIYDIYTDDEIYLMCRVIETETHGLSFEKKCNVANVILNRIASDTFPNNPTDVCTAAGQFAYSRTTIDEETLLALEYAFMIEDTTGGALYFRSDSSPATWNGKNLILNDGSHVFYG